MMSKLHFKHQVTKGGNFSDKNPVSWILGILSYFHLQRLPFRLYFQNIIGFPGVFCQQNAIFGRQSQKNTRKSPKTGKYYDKIFRPRSENLDFLQNKDILIPNESLVWQVIPTPDDKTISFHERITSACFITEFRKILNDKIFCKND